MGWTLVEGGLMGIASLYLKARKGLSQIVCVTEVVELAGASRVVAEQAGILLLWMRHASKTRWWSMHIPQRRTQRNLNRGHKARVKCRP